MVKKLTRRFQSLPLFLSLLLALGCGPLAEHKGAGSLIIFATYAALAAAGGYALLRDRRWLAAFAACIVVALGGEIAIALAAPVIPFRAFVAVAALALYGLLFKAVWTHSFFNPVAPMGDRLLAGICGYLLIVFGWASVFVFIETLSPGSFADPQAAAGAPLTRFSTVYYSLVTVSTLGYGDIVPVTTWARLAGGAAGLSGTLFLAVFIAAIMSGYRAEKGKR